jgi:hypothetical protein
MATLHLDAARSSPGVVLCVVGKGDFHLRVILLGLRFGPSGTIGKDKSAVTRK